MSHIQNVYSDLHESRYVFRGRQSYAVIHWYINWDWNIFSNNSTKFSWDGIDHSLNSIFPFSSKSPRLIPTSSLHFNIIINSSKSEKFYNSFTSFSIEDCLFQDRFFPSLLKVRFILEKSWQIVKISHFYVNAGFVRYDCDGTSRWRGIYHCV